MPSPLCRWTIGPVSPVGFEILSYSVKTWKNIFPEFETVICHNQLNSEQLKYLQGLNTPLYDQNQDRSLPFTPDDCKWKLYPPQLAPGRHELFLDNDLVVYRRSPVIEKFIENDDMAIMTEGLARNFGSFDHLVRPGVKLNCGLFGVPPSLDFARELTILLRNHMFSQWINYFDDQGLISAVLLNCPQFNTIPISEIFICLDRLRKTPTGLHFVGANKGTTKYWSLFKESRQKLM